MVIDNVFELKEIVYLKTSKFTLWTVALTTFIHLTGGFTFTDPWMLFLVAICADKLSAIAEPFIQSKLNQHPKPTP